MHHATMGYIVRAHRLVESFECLNCWPQLSRHTQTIRGTVYLDLHSYGLEAAIYSNHTQEASIILCVYTVATYIDEATVY